MDALTHLTSQQVEEDNIDEVMSVISVTDQEFDDIMQLLIND